MNSDEKKFYRAMSVGMLAKRLASEYAKARKKNPATEPEGFAEEWTKDFSDGTDLQDETISKFNQMLYNASKKDKKK